jgi:Xaa-Pro aminopeptidase
VYAIVLETQELVAQHAKPGMYLMNKDFPEQSLHHIAVKNLEKYGYDKYFPHGIGHFLGMDVHDCGARTDMLQENDVITIEPGIYIPQEDLGIRIEDNYWIVQDGNVCLSEGLPKTIQELEDIKSTF